MADSTLNVDATRGALALAALALLTRGPAHGYALIDGLADLGLPDVRSGTLYPLLRRLDEAGLVSAEWETPGSGAARKAYRITDQGRAAVRQEAPRLAGLAHAITDTISRGTS